jgi:hypothetical protein
LHIQLWDKDILKYNDCVGEQTIYCDKFYKKAYHKNTTVNFFEKHKGAAKDRRQREKKLKKIEKIPDSKEDVPVSEEATDDSNSKSESSGGGGPTKSTLIAKRPSRLPVNGKFADLETVASREVDSDDDDFDVSKSSKVAGKNPMYETVAKKEPLTVSSNSSGEVKKSWFSFGFFSSKPKHEDEEPLLEDPVVAEKAKREAEAEEQEANDTIRSFKAMTGLFDEDPEESSWLKLDALDHNTGLREPRGQICYSIQLWPKDKAIAMPVGSGSGFVVNFVSYWDCHM